MTPQEIIEALQAHIMGEEIEVFLEHSKKWIDLDEAILQNIQKYRVKPKEPKCPFKAGDLIFHKKQLDRFSFNSYSVYEIREIDNENGKILPIGEMSINFHEAKDWINIHDDSLFWYWEVQNKSGVISQTTKRKNYKEVLNDCEVQGKKLLNPIYSLGVVVKDSK